MINLNTLKNMTLFKKISIVLFIIFIISLGYCLWNRKQLVNIQNNKEKIAEQFNTDNIRLTMYYVDWCPHCVEAKPHFEKLVGNKTILGKNVNIEMVDCEKEVEKAAKANIKTYPTIKLNNNGNVIDYKGERNERGIMSWLKRQLL